ncbi:MAG: hypothetical protein ACE15D_04345 [Candidatus Eisenbacteria bacterium]|nr:hypothetical protein [Candidatus Eisenbacteria bacterium]
MKTPAGPATVVATAATTASASASAAIRICALAAALALVLALPLSRAAAAEPSEQWLDLYDAGGAYSDYATAAVAAPNGDLIVGGETRDGINGSAMSVRRLARQDGRLLWLAEYLASDGNDMALTSIVLDPFGDVLVGGYVRGCVG